MRAKFIDEGELDALAAAMSAADFLPFAVALETGLRIGDVLKIRHSDVKGRYLHFVAQKTGKAGRAQISAFTARKLREHNGSVWAFPGRDPEKPLTRQAAWARIKRACERSGVKPDGISPHSLRKCFAVELSREQGAEAARRALQHTDLRTTELYVLSDWLTGENAEKPLCRKDIAVIAEEIFQLLKLAVDKL